MKAIIISAGQGSRLLPLTLEMPKCLVHVAGRAILDHQIDALAASGIDEIVVVGGYRYDQLAAHVAARDGGPAIMLVRNPFWTVASSIGSVWAARDHLAGRFMLMNGDTIFDPGVVTNALDTPPGIGLVVERLADPEPDDMRVAIDDGRVIAVAKTLEDSVATHRSLGIIVSSDPGGGGYRDTLDEVIGEPGGIDAYHHAVIDRLARRASVVAIENRAVHWQEIDRPEDIARWTHDHATRASPPAPAQPDSGRTP